MCDCNQGRLPCACKTEPGPHLNSADKLPPVDCPLLIEIQPYRLAAASRTSFITTRDRQMEYRLQDGTIITGRYRWTYP